jgi:heterotetrameric sarcosine oxidase gamma subunit
VLGRGFALALVSGGRARIGATLQVPVMQGSVEVTVVKPVFHDPAGDRLRGVPGQPAEIQTMLPRVPDASMDAQTAIGVDLAVLPAVTRLSVRAGAAAASGMGMAMGVLLPSAPCRTMSQRERAALWLGPDEWLVLAPANDTTLVASALKGAGSHSVSVVDVSNATVALEITGSRAAWCLNAFCALDLHLPVFPIGMCTRTLLGKAPIILWRTGAETFRLEVGRSFLPYVWACLEEARREFALETVVADNSG